ncbi:MAG: xylulose-5-phosphate/fructose-6-phosphate phosphoketolase [Pseudohongiellaceae bacterium]|jgi:xylulose-5-phosphate/fructose-6-phosphate phosphoketolase
MGKITGIDALNDTKLSDQELYQIDAYWRACNYLAVGMIYLQDNPLLKSPLEVNDLKNDY